MIGGGENWKEREKKNGRQNENMRCLVGKKIGV